MARPNPTLMDWVKPNPQSKWGGFESNSNGFELGPDIMHTRPEPDPYIFIKIIKNPNYKY